MKARFTPGPVRAPRIHYVNRVADFTDNTGNFVVFLSLTFTPSSRRLWIQGHVNGQAAALGGALKMRITENGVVVRRAWQYASGASTPYEGADLFVVRDVAVGVPITYNFELSSNGANLIYCRPTTQADVEYGQFSIIEGFAP